MSDRPSLFAPHAFANADALATSLAPRVSAALLASAGDISLVIDADGVISDVAIASGELVTHGLGNWVGQTWLETATIESKPKIMQMLADSVGPEPARWRQINHPTPGGDIPVRYLTMRLEQGGAIAIGRDMRAAAAMQQRLLQTQQSLERDYIKLRQAEARYRMLFDLGTEPVLIIDAATRRIREINPAAARLIEQNEEALADQPVGTIVDPADREELIAHLGAASASDDLPPISVRLASGQDVAISARLFRQGRAALLLLRLLPATLASQPQGDPLIGAKAIAGARAIVGDVIEHMPDAFVLVDAQLDILFANAAFVELTGVASVARVSGAPLATWLGRPGIDLELIVGQLREHGAVRNVATILRSTVGGQEEIEISGVVAPHGDSQCYGFTIRNVGRRLRTVPTAERDLPRSVEQLTELVGRMSMKDIVRESTDLIERLCIEAALAYTSDNRASAAEILGISRQSLYSKLHRHGLGNLVSGDN